MYEMKPEYYIGIDMIDEEHKQFIKCGFSACGHDIVSPCSRRF